jgi:glycerol-3-phosphate dehydrogenase
MKRKVNLLEKQIYDLLVIGGGIYGACIAWDATLRGLSVALLEKDDFGHATSANSMKTIHGGLRYLQKADFQRIRQSTRERATLMCIAPHLVHPLTCMMPVYGHKMKGREMMAIALLINDLISYDRNRSYDPQKHIPRGRVISAGECLNRIPGIDSKGLTGAAVWCDAQVYNSERLTLAFIMSAAEQGAIVLNDTEVIGFLQANNRVSGVEAIDKQTGDIFTVRAKATVNAAGPWVNNLLGKMPGEMCKIPLHLAKAINVATKKIFPDYAVGISLRSNDQTDPLLSSLSERLLFIVPWRNQSLIGTIYKLYQQEPSQLLVTERDVDDIIHSVNKAYPLANLTPTDIQFVYSGLVPVSNIDPRKGTFQRDGQFRLYSHKGSLEGLITVLGVKYTTARDVAEKVVDRVFSTLGRKVPRSTSSKVPLVGGNIESFQYYLDNEIRKRPEGLNKEQIQQLVYNYGTRYVEVLRHINRMDGSNSSVDRAILEAQVLHAVREEMALHLSDVLLRRTDIGTMGYPGSETVMYCAQVMGRELHWDTGLLEKEIQELEGYYLCTSAFYEKEKSNGVTLAGPTF